MALSFLVKCRTLHRDKRGFFLIVTAGLMFFFCFLAAMTIDVGRAYLVKGQLQNAADATALAGAGKLYQNTTPPAIQLAVAQTTASDFIVHNRADGQQLTSCEVGPGFWDTRIPAPQTLQATPVKTGVCSATDADCNVNSECLNLDGCLQVKVPAVRVTVNKPVKSIFGGLIGSGWGSFQPRATAVAVSGFPGSVPAGTVFPFVLTQCLLDDFLAGLLPADDFQLNANHDTSRGQMLAGQWSDLSANASMESHVVAEQINYLAGSTSSNVSSPPSLSVKNSIPVDTVNASPYEAARKLLEAGRGLVLMPVVGCNITPSSTVTVKGFVGVRLASATGTILMGRFAPEYTLPHGCGPGGVTTNAFIPPKLVQ